MRAGSPRCTGLALRWFSAWRRLRLEHSRKNQNRHSTMGIRQIALQALTLIRERDERDRPKNWPSEE